jgi:hypothetical protein
MPEGSGRGRLVKRFKQAKAILTDLLDQSSALGGGLGQVHLVLLKAASIP